MAELNSIVGQSLHHSWLSRNWIYAPILVCVLIMLPRLISPQFGLMDDGRALTIAQGFLHGKFDLSWDVVAGRARPIYWAAFAFWYLLVGGHPFWYFLGNLIVFSATTFLLIHLVVDVGGSKLQALLTGFIFVFSTSLIENVYTLSKAENFQLLLMVSAISLVILAARSARGARYWLLLVASASLPAGRMFYQGKHPALAAHKLGLVGNCLVGEVETFPFRPLRRKGESFSRSCQPGEWCDLLPRSDDLFGFIENPWGGSVV